MSGLYKKYVFVFLCLFLFLSNGLSLADNGWRYADNSVLSQGDWYKIKIDKGTGIYKLTYDDLKNIGLNNPADVKIYGYGGWILDEDFNNPYIDDLPEVSIWMSNDRANFGRNDYILFYARADIKWEYNKDKGEFEQTQNPYSFDSYYFVTESSEYPKLVEKKASLAEAGMSVTTFNDYALHESEEVNIGKTGREFYGENFLSNNKRQFTFSTEGATSQPAIIHYDFVSKAGLSSCTLKVRLNNELIDTKYSQTTNEYYTYGTTMNYAVAVSTLRNQNTIELEMTKQDDRVTNAYLNYIRLNYVRELRPYGAVTLFRNTTESEALTYQISNAGSSMLVFDVTDNTDVNIMDTRLSGNSLSFTASNASLREYALVDLSKDIPKPAIIKGKIENQNLHALSRADMIIIAPEIFVESARELAELHKAESGLTSHIITPELIYNEFSSGKPDVTAYRRFLKMFYDRASDDSEKPKYLLLFGSGTFDNRFVGVEWENNEKKNSMLLTYQSKESLLELASYVTDDYMGFLDDNINIKNLDSAIANVGIGRLPAQTVQEARNVVAKIRDYMMNQNKGLWLNNITFVADDFVASSNAYNTEKQHIEDAENFSKYIESNYSDFIINKIYEDAYERVSEGTSFRYPDATQALLDRINNGTMVLSFIGHGSSRYWTHEYLLHYSLINNLNNDKLGLWVTATCDFSRFDDHREKSGGELAVIKRTGGAIGLFSTVRTVYIAHNTVMNEYITKHLLTKENGKPMRLGDILRNVKSEPALSSNISKLRFILLGDPALRLAYPNESYKVQIDQINGLDISDETINLRALDDVAIVGHIVDNDGNIVSDYNGVLESVIFDSEQLMKTKGNGVGSERAKEYMTYPNTLFAGRVEVKNGEFRVNFTVSTDILNLNGKGKMNFYAYDETGERQAQGSFLNYTVGGTNPGVPEEENPPVIERIFMDDTEIILTNQNRVSVGPMPKFVAEISDDTGINLSSGSGRNIALIIDNGTSTEEYDLNSYFLSNDGSTKRGSVTFNIPELAPGNYTLEFVVWDVFNNSASEFVDFTVTNDKEGSDYAFEIWGNPAREMTKFVFKTKGEPADNVDLRMCVYSLSGQLVWIREERGAVNTLNVYEYDWNLDGSGGGRVMPGIYICTGQAVIDGKPRKVQAKKLIVVN